MARKTVVWVAATLGLVVALGAAWWLQQPASTAGSSSANTPATPVVAGPRPGGGPGGPGGPGMMPNVEVAPVTVTQLIDDAQSVGSLRSRQSVMLKPEVSGRIVRIGFADGDQVRAGQLMFQLDDALQQAELSQAQAQLSIARANLQRNEELVAQNFVAQRVLDESRASLQVAEAQVQLAQARLQRMKITAPFNGTVGIRNVSVGEFVRDGVDLVNLEDLSELYVDFRLPERYQARISRGQSVSVQLDALPGQTFTGRVQAIDPLLDENGRALMVRAVLATTASSSLRPGLFARVNLVMSVQEAALMVPEEAIVPQGGRQVVFVVEREGEGDVARSVVRRTEVTLGIRRGAMVHVVDGLKPDAVVVIAGQQRLQRDGMPVRVIDLSRPPGTPARPQG